MGAYILRRLLLIIPTLVGIMVINFALTQFVPGGPIEQVLARVEGEGDSIQAISGGGDAGIDPGGAESGYVGARGLDPDFLAELEVQFGFARFVCEPGFTGEPSAKAPECVKEAIPALERFFIMMWNYLRFDFGESHFRSIGVMDLVLQKMPVSIRLGLWSTVLAYLI
jgi:microcin C transport system permease protein